jgi:hypothetical protein
MLPEEATRISIDPLPKKSILPLVPGKKFILEIKLVPC